MNMLQYTAACVPDTPETAEQSTVETCEEREELLGAECNQQSETNLVMTWKLMAGSPDADGEMLAKYYGSYSEQEDSMKHLMREDVMFRTSFDFADTEIEYEYHRTDEDDDDTDTVTSDEWCVLDKEHDVGLDITLVEDLTAQQTGERMPADEDISTLKREHLYDNSTGTASTKFRGTATTYYHGDRASFDERMPEDEDRVSFGFYATGLSTEDIRRPSEPGIVSEPGTDVEAEYFAAQVTDVDRKCLTPFDDWYSMSIRPVSDWRPLESTGLAAEYKWTPLLSEDVEEGHFEASMTEDDRPHLNVAGVPGQTRELPSQLTAESCRDEIQTDQTASIPAVSEDIPLDSDTDVSVLDAESARGRTSQVSETTVLPPWLEETTSSPSVTSTSMFVAANVERGQSSEQMMSLSFCDPVYSHPDVVGLESCFESELPVVLQGEQVRGEVSEEARVPFEPHVPSQSESVEEMRQPDGTIVRRRVIRTRVRRVATRRTRRRQPDGSLVEYTESVELPEDHGDDQQLSELMEAASEGAEGQVTDVAQPGEPQTDTDVEVIRETLPDGRIAERRIVRTRQRRTLVKRVALRPDRP